MRNGGFGGVEMAKKASQDEREREGEERERWKKEMRKKKKERAHVLMICLFLSTDFSSVQC